jgi:hypothetical protein
MEGEEARQQLQEKYPNWRIWRNGNVAYAWWLKSVPQIMLTDSSFAGLEERIPLAEEAWERTRLWRPTMKAARQPMPDAPGG